MNSYASGPFKIVNSSEDPSSGTSYKRETPSNWEIPASFAMLSHPNILSTVRAAATGEGSRSVFQANMPVVWEHVQDVLGYFVSGLRKRGRFLAGSKVELVWYLKLNWTLSSHRETS